MADQLNVLLNEGAIAVVATAMAFIVFACFVGPRVSFFSDARRAAHRRAEALLRSHLSERELVHLKRFGVLDVPSQLRPGRVYHVRAQSGRVLVHERGRCTMELCIRSRIELPGNEHVLAHKLMIQAAEDDYLARANVIWSRGQATVSGRLSRFD